MKRLTVVLLLCAFALGLCSCGGDTEENGDELSTYIIETEPEETYTVEIEYPEIDEISPKTVNPEIPITFTKKIDIERVRKYSPIKPANSYIPETTASEVYVKGSNQYFVFNDTMAFVIYTDNSVESKRTYCYSAYYAENSELYYIGDDIYSWYYMNDGSLNVITYTYYLEGVNLGVTFYDEDGNRVAYYSQGIYYDKNLNQMDADATYEFRAKLGDIKEFTE